MPGIYADGPLDCVSIGTGKAFENMDMYKRKKMN